MEHSPLEADGNSVGRGNPPFVEHYTMFAKAYHCTISLASFIQITVFTPCFFMINFYIAFSSTPTYIYLTSDFLNTMLYSFLTCSAHLILLDLAHVITGQCTTSNLSGGSWDSGLLSEDSYFDGGTY
jgi:hypothetical protein